MGEERSVKVLLDELLGSSGSNIAVVPSNRYVEDDEEVSFMGVARRAVYFDEVLIGYQKRRSVERTVLNPPHKTEERTWEGYDFAILQQEQEYQKARTSSRFSVLSQ